MKANYHTHTPRCKHADGPDELYVQTAIQEGFTSLGFADHTPWPYQSGYVSGIRMDVSQLPDYVSCIRALKEKYSSQIKLRIGLECEYFPRYFSWLKEAKEALGLDYLIFGAHFIGSDEDSPYMGSACADDKVLSSYTDMCIEGMNSGMYVYLAHPDLYMRHRKGFDMASRSAARAICECALANNMPLEYNLNAYVIKDWEHGGFPRRDFWEVAAQMGNRVIIGYDAHQPSLLQNTQAVEEVRALLAGIGITPMDCLDMDK